MVKNSVAFPNKIHFLKRSGWWIAVFALVLIVIGGTGWILWGRPSTTVIAGETLQTTTVKRGNILLSASGTAALNPRTSDTIRFRGTGQVEILNTALGSHVAAGDLLASLNDSTAQLALTQAKRDLQELTSDAALQTQKENIITATATLAAARETLANYISPDVLNYEELVAADQKELQAAIAQQADSPSAESDQKVQDAQIALQQAQAGLAAAQDAAGIWLWNAFSYKVTSVYNNCKPHAPCSSPGQTSVVTTIYSPPSALQVATARAAYAVASKTLADEQLYLTVLETGEIPADATGAKITTLEKARQQVKDAQDTLDGTHLVAPIAGTVTALSFKLGDSITSSGSITIADLDQPYMVDYYLDEADWHSVNIGNAANVTFDILADRTFTGNVASVDPILSTQNSALYVHGLVQLDPIKDLTLPTGTGGSINIIGGQAANVALVPIAALHEYAPGQYAVFVVVNGKLTLRMVTIGLQDLVNAEVKSGLQQGDVVSTGIAQTS